MKKHLEQMADIRPPSGKPKQRHPKVTIAIGLIHKVKKESQKIGPDFLALPAIWMASDSQTTYGATKRENPNKISSVEFINGQILVAQADSVELGDKTIERLRHKAKGTEMENAETAINTVRSALLEVRTELLEWNKGCNLDYEKFFWTEHRLNLLVGYYFKEEAYLFKMDIYRGIPTRVDSFEAIGGGESLGYFLLKESSKANPDFSQGMPIAVSVVEKVIDNVDGCGRPTWVGNVFPVPGLLIHHNDRVHTDYQCFTGMLPRQDTDLLAQELKHSDERLALLQKKHIVNVMGRASKKFKRLFEQQRKMHMQEEHKRHSPKK